MMKKICLALLATSMLFPVTEITTPETTSALYPNAGIVTEIDNSVDTVTVTMANGNMFVFYGVEDWCKGDLAALTMDDNGTEEVYDDIIVNVKYAGTSEMLIKK